MAWNPNDPASIEDYAIYVSQREGVSVGLVLGIIKAESGFNPKAKNPASSASGIAQYINRTFQSYCIDKYDKADSMKEKNNPFRQINCMVEMLKEPKGYQHWLPSVKGWGHLLKLSPLS